MKPLKRKEFIKKLRKYGFTGPYSGGRHQFMIKGSLKLRIPNPHQKDISVSLLKEILKQADISIDEWDSL